MDLLLCVATELEGALLRGRLGSVAGVQIVRTGIGPVNAAHAIHDSGKDVSTGRITVVTRVAGDSVEVEIGDNGCGIAPENVEKIFDPFFTTKEVGRGTGQGLAIAHSIVVDKHGGDISVHSELGVGTRFTLRLPTAGRANRNAA